MHHLSPHQKERENNRKGGKGGDDGSAQNLVNAGIYGAGKVTSFSKKL